MRPVLSRAMLLAAFAVLAASCALPGNVTGSREITAMFDDVGDLVTGHSVQVADVRIGSVTDIELTDDYRARVTMSIKDDISSSIRPPSGHSVPRALTQGTGSRSPSGPSASWISGVKLLRRSMARSSGL